jgi:hypothetical protein
MTEMFDRIVAALKTLRYNVETRPQEKIPPGELHVVMENVDVEVESFSSYVMNVDVSIRWAEETPAQVPRKIATLMAALDAAVSQPTFKFGKPNIRLLGQQYLVDVPCSYKEIVEVT